MAVDWNAEAGKMAEKVKRWQAMGAVLPGPVAAEIYAAEVEATHQLVAQLPIDAGLAHKIAHDAIGLFLENRDQHGLDEVQARAEAEREVAEGAAVQLPGESPWDIKCAKCGDWLHQPSDAHPGDERWFDTSGDPWCYIPSGTPYPEPHRPDAPDQPCGAAHPPLPFTRCAACEAIRAQRGCAVDPDCTVAGPHEHDEARGQALRQAGGDPHWHGGA
jgi:hypothetical protein